MYNQPLVSVIIPVFNVEKYLDACLKSVVNQDYSDVEIILVDDGSTDASSKMCDEWARKDSRIKVIHKKNEGLNYARRDGFKKSSGEYVTFLDSDDLLHKESVKIFLGVLVENGVDAVVSGSREFSDDSKGIGRCLSVPEVVQDIRTLDSIDTIIGYAMLGEPCFPDANYMTAWGKMYSRKLIDGVNWKESNFRSYEDNFWTPQLLLSASKVALIPNQLHFYRRNAKYGINGGTLGNRLTGNSINGKPVGYIEYLDMLHKFNKKLAGKRGVNIDAELQELYDKQSWSRLSVLTMADLLDRENNLEYAKDVLAAHQRKDWQLQQHNAELDRRVLEYSIKIERLEGEVAKFYGIKHTARRLLGNIRRRLLGS